MQQLFKQFKEQRLTNAALECEQLINRGTQQLTEVKVLTTDRCQQHVTIPVESSGSAVQGTMQASVAWLVFLSALEGNC